MTAAPESSVVALSDVTFAWRHGPLVLDIPALRLAAGEKFLLRGPSGSGKSTLLGLVCGVLAPQSGRVGILGRDMARLSGIARDALRARHIGVIFQMFNLLPYLSVLENVLLPCRFSRARSARAGDAQAEARRLLSRLGLDGRRLASTAISRLSVGQQQRVAAARALIGRPELIVADEPTSALDADSRDAFIDLLADECRQSGASLLFVSHDRALAPHFDRVVELPQINRAGLRDAA